MKECQAIKYLNVESFARKLLPRDAMAKWRKEKDNWHGIVKELRYFLKQKAERHLTRPHVVYALFEAGGDAKFIDDVMFAGKMRTPKGMYFRKWKFLGNTPVTVPGIIPLTLPE